MKVSVSYNERTYGNSSRSTASEITISGIGTNVDMKIQFKQPQPGRSWDWMSSASVGGASIEMSCNDAIALAEALLTSAVVLESAQRGNYVEVSLRLREGAPPERTLRNPTVKELSKQFLKKLSFQEIGANSFGDIFAAELTATALIILELAAEINETIPSL